MTYRPTIQDALIVADDACGFPLHVLLARLEVLEGYPAIRQQIVDEIIIRQLRAVAGGSWMGS